MKSMRYAVMFLGLASLLLLASLVYAAGHLPEHLATHFDWSGQPNGWMGREAYLVLTAGIGIGFPVFLMTLCWVTRFLPASMVNLPHRDYWLAPERRAETARYLGRHSLWLGAAAIVFITGVNLLTINANNHPSAHLSSSAVLLLAGSFVAVTALWTVALYRHFRAPDPRVA
jgi:hypothetical protein